MSDPRLHTATDEHRDEHAAILKLLAAAKYLKDAEDEQGFAEVWTREASLTIDANGKQIGPIIGRDAIMDFYRDSWARGQHGTAEGRETHIAEHPHIIAIGPAHFRTVHNAIFAAMAGDAPILIGFATFTDEIAFEDGRWRIGARTSSIRRRAN